MADTRQHHIWTSMRKRCSSSAVGKDKKNYFDRGIRVCPEWIESFEVFWLWSQAHGYTDELQINRKDNDGNYEPGNCEWTTGFVNARNKRNTRLNEEKVRQIIDLSATLNCGEIGRLMNLHRTIAYDVIHGRSWVSVVAQYATEKEATHA